jgi:hypothetical protein
MRMLTSITPPLVLLLLAGAVRSEERDRFADVLALQKAVRESIETVEPSIACILVSRSEKYKEFAPAQPATPGQLGRFDLRTARLGVRDHDPRYKAIGRLDLSDPNNVPESYSSGVVIDERRNWSSPWLMWCARRRRFTFACRVDAAVGPTSTPSIRAVTWPCCA